MMFAADLWIDDDGTKRVGTVTVEHHDKHTWRICLKPYKLEGSVYTMLIDDSTGYYIWNGYVDYDEDVLEIELYHNRLPYKMSNRIRNVVWQGGLT